MAEPVIISGAKMGEECIINTCSSVDHDCIIGNYVHVSVGSHLAGTVKIGNRTWVGAGAVVIKDIEKSGTYIGVPANNIDEVRKQV